MNSRRNFLLTAAAATAGAVVSRSVGATASAAAQALATPPARNASLRGRNLFNGDSCVFFYNPEKWQPEDFTQRMVDGKLQPFGGPFKPIAIDRFVANLATHGIDTFLVNANASRAWYPSKVIPTILDGYRRGDREYFRGHAICQGATDPVEVEKFIDRIMAFMNLYQDLLDQHVDWLAEAAKSCRQHGVAPWVSIRMNDFHGSKNIDGSFFNVPLLKNPAMRLKHGSYSPTMYEPTYRTALNYERPEVRALMMAQIKEVVEDYDYEGLELDWLRNPMCCEPNASAETIEMMNQWVREVRALTQRRAAQLGRPYPLGVRIPGKLETMKSIGLDVATLAREGTLDFVSPSSFWCTSWEMPHDTLRQALGDRVAIYGVIEDGANFMTARAPELKMTQDVRFISSSREAVQANAAGKLALGADGIEWYNFFCTDQARFPGLISDYSVLPNIQHADFLRGKPKHYSFTTTGSWHIQPPFDITPQLPIALPPMGRHPFRIPLAAEPADTGLEVVVQVVLKAGDAPEALPVAFNDCWPKVDAVLTDRLLFPCGSLTHLGEQLRGYNFTFPVSLVREGWNGVMVENGGKQPISIMGIDLAIRPSAKA